MERKYYSLFIIFFLIIGVIYTLNNNIDKNIIRNIDIDLPEATRGGNYKLYNSSNYINLSCKSINYNYMFVDLKIYIDNNKTINIINMNITTKFNIHTAYASVFQVYYVYNKTYHQNLGFIGANSIPYNFKINTTNKLIDYIGLYGYFGHVNDYIEIRLF